MQQRLANPSPLRLLVALAALQKCGFTDPTAPGNKPLVLGTVLAAPQAAAAEAGLSLAGGAAAQAEQQQLQQQLAALKLQRWQYWQQPLVALGMLAMAGLAGAVAALRWARHSRGAPQAAAGAGRSRPRSLSASPLRA